MRFMRCRRLVIITTLVTALDGRGHICFSNKKCSGKQHPLTRHLRESHPIPLHLEHPLKRLRTGTFKMSKYTCIITVIRDIYFLADSNPPPPQPFPLFRYPCTFPRASPETHGCPSTSIGDITAGTAHPPARCTIFVKNTSGN